MDFIVRANGVPVGEEGQNKPFVCFLDADGNQLDGSLGTYRWHCPAPPPGGDIWSLTLYEVSTGQVFANELDRYKVGLGVDGCRSAPDGSWTITMGTDQPDDESNWLPAPAAPFFVAIRTWNPADPVLDGTWLPQPIHKMA